MKRASREPLPGSDIVFPEVQLHACTVAEPAIGTMVRNDPCDTSRSTGFCRHVEFDVTGTPLEGVFTPGQAFGVIPPGVDDRGRPHQTRLYSLACPSGGEDGQGRIISTTVKRLIDEHHDTGALFLGVASNFICDMNVGDEAVLTGPTGKRFVLPVEIADHDYLLFATGTGIAPFRGFVKDILAKAPKSAITLVMGVTHATELIYDEYFRGLDEAHDRFTYLTAFSREPQPDGAAPMRIDGRFEAEADRMREAFASERTLAYICGIAGMELALFGAMKRVLPPESLAQFLIVAEDAPEDPREWTRKHVHRQLKATKRVMMEVYA